MFSESDAVLLADLRRRMANIIRIGTVVEVDYAKAVARITIGELKTTWLPWILRAGDDQSWHGVDIGEQVLVLAPSGDLAQGVILPSLHKETPVCQGNIHSMTFKDGSHIVFDRDTGDLQAVITGNLTASVAKNIKATCQTLVAECAATATIKAPAITLDGNVTITQNLAVAGSIAGAGNLAAGGMVTLSGGGPPIARVGDKVVVNGTTHEGTIVSGSGTATSG
jgi:phage baseplate assembly protein V